MRLIFAVFTAIVVIAAALFFFAPLLVSTDEVRDQLLAQVESATGYRLRVDGPVKFSLFPSLDLVAKDVGVAQRGAAGAEIATAQELRFGLVWSALWGGKVQLTEVTLIDPVIAVPAKVPPAQTAEGAAPAGQAGSGGRSAAAALQNLTLDKLVIENGTVILPASADAQGKRIEQLNLEVSLPSFDGPLSFDAEAVYDGKPLAASGSVGNFGPFLSGTPSPVSLAVESPSHLPDRVAVNGTATYKDDAFTLSQFTAKAGDKSLAGTATYKNEMLTLSQFTANAYSAAVTGSATYKGNLLTLHPFTTKAYGSTISGSLAADLSSKVPGINAALTADTLNINALMPKPVRGASAGGGGGGTGEGGSAGGSGWSDAKIDFSPLRAVNAKLKLTAQQLIYDNIKISSVALEATLMGGKLNATLPNFKLYNGAGAASLAVDASGQTPAQRVKLTLTKFAALPLLKDVANFQNIEGTGTIALDLAASGASQRAMVQTLSGTSKLDFADGAIRGINVAKTVRSLTQGTLSGWQEGAAEKTDFATLAASFNLTNGQAQTKDLRLIGPLVRMSGEGTVNLPPRTLQFRVNPQIVASLEGQGGKEDMQGLGVPVMIAGPWASPRIYPDIKGILENPVAAYEQLNKLGGSLKKLPNVDQLGEKVDAATGVPGLSNVLKDGKLNKEGLQQGAIEGLGQLLNKQTGTKPVTPPPAEPARTEPAKTAPAEPAAQPAEGTPKAATGATKKETGDKKDKKQTASEPEQPVDKAKQKQQEKKQQKREAEDAAKQMLQNLFGN